MRGIVAVDEVLRVRGETITEDKRRNQRTTKENRGQDEK